MSYVLLFVATLSSTPTYLGEYKSEDLCIRAIRSIYETRVITTAVNFTDEQRRVINQVIDAQMKLQHEYKCVKE